MRKAKLAAVREGRIRRVINRSPRHLKSHLASVAFRRGPSGAIPASRFFAAPPGFEGDGPSQAWSAGQDLADKLSRDYPRILASDWYRQILATRLSAQRHAASEFDTTAQGCRLATSFGGVLTVADTHRSASDATFCRIGCSLGMVNDCKLEDHKRSARITCRESRRLIGETRRVINESRRIIEETRRLMKDSRRDVSN